MSQNFARPVPASNKLGGSIFMAIALVILGFAVFNAFRNWQFETKGEHTTGTIDNRSISYGHHQTVKLNVQYHYVAEAATRLTTNLVSNEIYGQLHVGSEVPVVFLPWAPADSRLDLTTERQRYWNQVYLLAMIGLPLFAFAAFIYRLDRGAKHA
jgi:hypothetical protein